MGAEEEAKSIEGGSRAKVTTHFLLPLRCPSHPSFLRPSYTPALRCRLILAPLYRPIERKSQKTYISVVLPAPLGSKLLSSSCSWLLLDHPSSSLPSNHKVVHPRRERGGRGVVGMRDPPTNGEGGGWWLGRRSKRRRGRAEEKARKVSQPSAGCRTV